MRIRPYYSPDEPPTDTPADTPVSDTPAEPSPWIDTSTGKLGDGWKEHVPEELRGEKILDTVVDFGSAMKSLVHHHKMVGKDKIVRPSETSPQADWDAFYEAAGRPSTADDYGFAFDGENEKLNEYLDKDLTSNFLKEMHEKGASKDIVDIVKKYKGMELLNATKLMEQREQEEIDKAEASLKKEWGEAYDERLDLCVRVIEDTTEEGETREALKEAIGNNPVILGWVHDLSKKMVETKLIDTKLSKSTPMELDGKISDLRATPGYQDGTLAKTDPKRFEAIGQQILDLYRQMEQK